MKTLPPPCPAPATGPRYWRSLDELAETPEFRQWVEQEFPAGASELNDPVTRRYFVKIMSASFLLAGFGLTGCRRPEESILPFSTMPEDYVHGLPQCFATALPTRGSALPLVVKSSDGRPTKIEGNALFPGGNAGTDAFAQAALLNLYDPDRATRATHGGTIVSREAALDFLAQLGRDAAAKGGQGLAFLLERSSAPSRDRLQQRLTETLPRARWFVHEPVDFDIHRQAASRAAGQPVRPVFHLEAARRILTLDCDVLGTEEDAHRFIRDFARGRRLAGPGSEMNRLYTVESLMTLTGMNADHRLRAKPSQIGPLAAALAAEVLKLTGHADVAGGLEPLAARAGDALPWVKACARDLVDNGAASVVLAGHRQPMGVHLAAYLVNSALGSLGKAIRLQPAPEPRLGSLADLAQALKAGEVETLVSLGGNPVYTAPVDLDWAAAQRKARTVVRLGDTEDETFPVCDWHLPRAHCLESWGDARTADGTLVPVQPLIEPLFGGLTELEVLARLGGLPVTRPHEIVRETFRGLAGADGFEERWKRLLHDGFLADSAPAGVSVPPLGAEALRGTVAALVESLRPGPDAAGGSGLEVVFARDLSVDDGRFTNNGWLQEMPDPVTKLVWENVILLSPKTAHDLGVDVVDHEDNRLTVPVVKVRLDGREIEGPAWVQPGQADGVIGLALGYGRDRVGRVGRGSGYNAYRLRSQQALHCAGGAQLEKTGRTHPLSTTQNHWAMEGRPVIREANLDEYQKNPKFARRMNMEEPPVDQPIYPNPIDALKAKAAHQWGMAIDLNACVGCSACVLACQSENNIPIVGKDQVGRSREMHWLRLDRYYSGDTAHPQVAVQPMLCQHCEAAPCESVCPVNATAHDDEGLNVMVYNRCVGTRYCSNNCPYKVRRFNFFDYHRRTLDMLKGPVYPTPLTHTTEGEWDLWRWLKNPDRGYRPTDEWELSKLVRNPDVTVRMRGIMEKCTFCIQRIEQAKIAQKVKARDSANVTVPDGAVQTACQQACPAEAIVFGNINDPQSRVARQKADDRTYTVLEFLATKPRTTYQARVRHPNPAMPDYATQPLSAAEWEGRQGGGHGGPGAHGAPAPGPTPARPTAKGGH